MYSLNFVALLEPRISGDRADQVVNKLGVDGVTRVEATGFSGGIWCLWKSTSISVDVIHSMRFCVHLKINPRSDKPWALTVVYASRQAHLRDLLWEELERFRDQCDLPWCVVGDFNTVMFGHEKDGGLLSIWRPALNLLIVSIDVTSLILASKVYHSRGRKVLSGSVLIGLCVTTNGRPCFLVVLSST